MTRLGVRIGISRTYKDNGDLNNAFLPMEISCFNSGRWLMSKKWINSTRWKMSNKQKI